MVTQHQINHLTNQIVKEFQPERIILFGSYAYGKPTVDSDVDLLVVMPVRNEAVREKAVEIYIAIDKAKAAPFSFDLLVRTPKQILRRIAIHDFFIREICEKGKVLYESSDTRVGRQGRRGLQHGPAAIARPQDAQL